MKSTTKAGNRPKVTQSRSTSSSKRGGRYYIDFRDARADTRFKDWRNDYFVSYLRRAFKWRGFPGWERHPNPSVKLIGDLADGLLSI